MPWFQEQDWPLPHDVSVEIKRVSAEAEKAFILILGFAMFHVKHHLKKIAFQADLSCKKGAAASQAVKVGQLGACL